MAQHVLAAAGVEGVSFDRLLEVSDFVSIHAPLVPATRGLFNADVFRKMKKGACLINTARGPLVDEEALASALDSGRNRPEMERGNRRPSVGQFRSRNGPG